MNKEFLNALLPHKGKIFGSLLGLLIGYVVLRFGVIRGFFLLLCLGAGFYLGNRYDAKGSILDLLDRFIK